MENLLASLMSLLNSGKALDGQSIIPIIMGLIIWHLLQERKKLVADSEKKDERLEKIIDDYHKGNLTLTEAFHSLRLVLVEIKSKIG